MTRRGFTLLEMMLVLALIVILGSLAYPSLTAMQRSYRLDGAADAAKGGLITARALAINEGRAYRFAIVPGKGNFRVAPDSPAYWEGNGSPTVPEGTRAPQIFESSLDGAWFVGDTNQTENPTSLEPGDVSLGMYRTVAVFLTDGTARAPDGTEDSQAEVVIPLATEGTQPIAISLRLLTGTVTRRHAQ